MKSAETTATICGVLAGIALVAKGLRSRRAIDFRDRVVLITGGSRGLGLLVARELGRQGARLILVARDAAELQRAQEELQGLGVSTAVVVADISHESEARQIVNDAVAQHGRLDLLVNNAGIMTVGPVDHMSLADFEDAMATHFWGPLHTMRAAVPHMREAGGGRIVNISSIGGKIGVPHLTPYCASKFALTGVSSALGAELARDHILVTTVCPGLMRTGSPFNAMFKGDHRHEFAWFAIAGSLPLLSINANRAARQIVDAARHGDAELVITWPARLAVVANAVIPNTIAHVMGLTNRALPGAQPARDAEGRSGWQSTSSWAPSVLTRLTERAAVDNNEVPPPATDSI